MTRSLAVYLQALLLLSSHSVVSSSLRPHGLPHTRLPCLSPSPRACSNSRPTILSPAIPFSFLEATTRNNHKPGGLKQQAFILSCFWRPKSRAKMVPRLVPSVGSRGGSLLVSSSLWGRQAFFGLWPQLSTQHLLLSHRLLCVSVLSSLALSFLKHLFVWLHWVLVSACRI